MPEPFTKNHVDRQVKPLPVKAKASLEEIDNKVLGYIVAHEGTVSLKQMAEYLDLTLEELSESVARLKERHLIE